MSRSLAIALVLSLSLMAAIGAHVAAGATLGGTPAGGSLYAAAKVGWPADRQIQDLQLAVSDSPAAR